jgi:hypothetical protein
MNFVDFSDAVQIYGCCQKATISREKIYHHLFFQFSTKVWKLARSLGDLKEEPNWQDYMRVFKQYSYSMSTLPLPFSFNADIARSNIPRLRLFVYKCSFSYPEFAERASEILELYSSLLECNDNPLGDKVAEYCEGLSPEEKVAIVLSKTNTLHDVESYLEDSDLPNIDVVVPPMLKSSLHHSKLIVIGPSRWFPRYIFNAPRGAEMLLFHYEWLRDHWEAESAFDGGVRSHFPIEVIRRGIPSINRISEEDLIAAEALVPKIDTEAIHSGNGVSGGHHHGHTEPVEAMVCVLNGENFTLIDKTQGAKTDIIDFQGYESTDSDVRRKILNTMIEPGMFLLLRTSGGGDYIVPIANAHLGLIANEYRSMQHDWKVLLREQVKRIGTTGVSQALRRHGSFIADLNNVRNWMSESTIKPKDRREYAAILRYVGLADLEEQSWAAACEIDKAHRWAGQHIRSLLLQKITNTDLSDLERNGRMDFELSQADGGSLTAFRVQNILPETVTVPHSRLKHVEKLIYRG